MKTKTAAATVGNAAKYLRAMAGMIKNKKVAQQMEQAAAALAQVRASLNRKAARKNSQAFKVVGFAPQEAN